MVAIRKDAEQTNHYKQMWMHERNRRIEVEQENIRLRKIVYNTKFSINERAIALEIAEQVKEARHIDEKGRKLFSQKDAANKLGLSRNTIGTAVDILTESGFIKNKDTRPLRDEDGKLVRDKDGHLINTTHLAIDQELYEDFSQAERSAPRKIKDARQKPTCRECGTEEVTIKSTKAIICRNPHCKKCGREVVIEETHIDQQHTDEQTEITHSTVPKIWALDTMDNPNAQILGNKEDGLESNNPPCDIPTPINHLAVISDWLEKRRGTPRIIQATGLLKSEDKYISKPETFEPDLAAYITGKIGHIYGSWLRNTEGKTSVLSFDCDTPHHNDQAQNYLLDLARAGAAAVYWQRQRDRGHLEVYFDNPVDPNIARQWLLEVCPDLEMIPECFPCNGRENRANHALSWPLWQRIAGTVHACKAYAMLPFPHDAGLQEVNPTHIEALANLITVAITPAALVEEFATTLHEREKLQPREQEASEPTGGVIGIKPESIAQIQGERDLVKQVIADFNHTHRIEDMVEVNKKQKFPAIWRGERTASVALDHGGEYATDYGQHGSFPKKLDAYEVYCLINNLDKKADLAERCAQLRRQQSQVVKIVEQGPTVQLFHAEQRFPQRVYTPCIVCSKPKNVLRADGAYVCGVEHSAEV
jgi:hypothetical protein